MPYVHSPATLISKHIFLIAICYSNSYLKYSNIIFVSLFYYTDPSGHLISFMKIHAFNTSKKNYTHVMNIVFAFACAHKEESAYDRKAKTL